MKIFCTNRSESTLDIDLGLLLVDRLKDNEATIVIPLK